LTSLDSDMTTTKNN